MNCGKISIEGPNIRSIVGHLVEASEKEYHICQADNVVVLIREGWSHLDLANFMSVFVLKFNGKERVDIEIISGGAEEAYLLSIVTEKHENRVFIRDLKKLCRDNRWVVTDVYPEELARPFLLDRLLKRESK